MATNNSKNKFLSTTIDLPESDRPAQWKQMDDFQENDLEEFPSNQNKPKISSKAIKPSINKKFKKANELEQYQSALTKLRNQSKGYYPPFDKQTLNILKMPAIKMLKDAIQSDKDFVKTLRNVGCKTRMRVRNKTAAKELFQVMLKYLQKSQLPHWMVERHQDLLKKDDSKFDAGLNCMDEKDE